MSLFNITVKVDTSETVPIELYRQLERRLNNIQSLHYKQTVRANEAEVKISSMLRELTNTKLDREFLEYLQKKYELTIKPVTNNG